MNRYVLIIFSSHLKQNIIIRSFLYILCMYVLILIDMLYFDIFWFFKNLLHIIEIQVSVYDFRPSKEKKQTVDF